MNIYTTGITALFSPADRPDRVLKALAGAADLVILDLEDAVAPDAESKHTARTGLQHLLEQVPHRSGVIIRINVPGTIEGDRDLSEIGRLSTLTGLPPFAVMVPKLEMDTPLTRIPDGIELIGLVETAGAVRDLFSIATLPRVSRLALGSVDLSAELGCAASSVTIDHARAQIVIASVAARIAAPLESPCINFQDPAVVSAAAEKAQNDGFGGMLSIHPKQLEGINKAFHPSEHEISWAKKVMNVGEAASSVDGEMVDRPVILRAQRILAALH